MPAPVSVLIMAVSPVPSTEPDRGDYPESSGLMVECLFPTQIWRKQGPWSKCHHTQSPSEQSRALGAGGGFHLRVFAGLGQGDLGWGV